MGSFVNRWNGSKWVPVDTPSPADTTSLWSVKRVPGKPYFWTVGHTDSGALVGYLERIRLEPGAVPDHASSDSLRGVSVGKSGYVWAVGWAWSDANLAPRRVP